jgi:hypothetical protein
MPRECWVSLYRRNRPLSIGYFIGIVHRERDDPSAPSTNSGARPMPGALSGADILKLTNEGNHGINREIERPPTEIGGAPLPNTQLTHTSDGGTLLPCGQALAVYGKGR